MSVLRDGHFVRLVPFDEKYGPDVFRWFYDYDYRFFFRADTVQYSEEDCKNYGKIMAAKGVEVFVITDKVTGEAYGLMTLQHTNRKTGIVLFGIMLDVSQQRKTHAIEALIILGDYAIHQLGCRKICVEYLAKDTHIRRIAEKGGFIQEAHFVEQCFVDGEYADEVRYYMMKSTYMDLYGEFLDAVNSPTSK